jgi:hypothetical protein
VAFEVRVTGWANSVLRPNRSPDDTLPLKCCGFYFASHFTDQLMSRMGRRTARWFDAILDPCQSVHRVDHHDQLSIDRRKFKSSRLHQGWTVGKMTQPVPQDRVFICLDKCTTQLATTPIQIPSLTSTTLIKQNTYKPNPSLVPSHRPRRPNRPIRPLIIVHSALSLRARTLPRPLQHHTVPILRPSIHMEVIPHLAHLRAAVIQRPLAGSSLIEPRPRAADEGRGAVFSAQSGLDV